MPQSDDDALIFAPKPDSILMDYSIEALVIPKVETVLDDALSILHMQLRKTGVQLAKSEEGLDSEGLRNLCSVVDAVSKVSREQRQRSDLEDEELATMSDEELEAELAEVE
jgi:hypothetical protein